VTSEFFLFCPIIIPDYIARGFVIEKESIDNDSEAGGPDMFGVMWEWVPQVEGSMVRPELPQLLPDVREWREHVVFPNLDDYDWEGCMKRNAGYMSDERPTIMWFMNGMFERLISFTGFENAALALIDNDQKSAVHELFGALCDLYEDILTRFCSECKADIIYFHDDWGGQYSPFFSPALVREMILPYIKRIIDFVHEQGMFFHFHSCGKIESLVPVMIEAGVDVWSGQVINDKLSVLKEHGGEIKIEVGPDLEIGESYSDEEIESKTAEFLDIYGDYLKDIIVTNRSGGERLYELVYAYSREKISGGD
jgi:hypothetical protein